MKARAGSPCVGPCVNKLLRERGRQITREQPKILEKSEIDPASFLRKELLESYKECRGMKVRMNKRQQFVIENALELKSATRETSQPEALLIMDVF